MRVEEYKVPEDLMGISNIVAKVTNDTEDAWSYVRKINKEYEIARVDDSGNTEEYYEKNYQKALEKAKELASY